MQGVSALKEVGGGSTCMPLRLEVTRLRRAKKCLRRGDTKGSASSLKRACCAEFGRVVCRDKISPSSPCMRALITNRTSTMHPGAVARWIWDRGSLSIFLGIARHDPRPHSATRQDQQAVQSECLFSQLDAPSGVRGEDGGFIQRSPVPYFLRVRLAVDATDLQFHLQRFHLHMFALQVAVPAVSTGPCA